MSGWIGADFDGTLAVYGIPGRNGEPIPAMVERVKQWLAEGKDVRIFTARVACSGQRNEQGVLDGQAYADEMRAEIQAWCLQHIGQVLPVTATKDFGMVALYDDRCVQVEMNTGRLVADVDEAAQDDLASAAEGCRHARIVPHRIAATSTNPKPEYPEGQWGQL